VREVTGFPTPLRAPREDAEGAPAPRGRDRRGMGDVKPRAVEPTVPVKLPRPTQAAIQRDAAPGGTIWLHGLHAVGAALANPRRRPRRLLLTVEAEAALEESFPKPWRLTAERVEKNRFQTFLPEDSIHQGAALLTEPLPPLPLEDCIATRAGPVLVLDQVTDPRNVGAILRSAAAFGAACVVMQDRHAPPETGALARAASGALELVPIAREVNLSRAIVALQRAGFWVLGLAGEGKRTLAEGVTRDRRMVLVLGAEDAGLRRLQRETCDELVRLPMAPGVESLNVAAAAAVALYEIARGGPEPVAVAEPDTTGEEEETEE
jgi:23S rRNA (guanosine2251-2'-O)-methyltransferase